MVDRANSSTYLIMVREENAHIIRLFSSSLSNSDSFLNQSYCTNHTARISIANGTVSYAYLWTAQWGD